MRTTSALLSAAGLCLALYVIARPWAQGDSPDAWAATSWPVSHAMAMLGFVLLAAAAQRIAVVHPTPGLRPLAWASVGLLLPYYGAEAFGLHALATVGAGNAADVAESIRWGAIQAVAFVIGWAALAALGIQLAVALSRDVSDRAQRVASWSLAVGLTAYFPVFFLPPGGRVAHGLLVAAAALATAWRLPRWSPACA